MSVKKEEVESKIKRLAEEASQLHTILEINKKILIEQPLHELLNYIVQSAINLLKTDAGTLRLADERKKFLVLKASISTHRAPHTKQLPINENSFAGQTFLKGNPIKCLNISQSSFYPWNGAETKKFTSLLTVPLKRGNTNLGVFSIYTKKKRNFSQLDIEMIEIFASQVTLAIINKTHLEETYQTAITEDLTSLYNQRYLHKRFEEEITRARRFKHFLSLVFIDIDNLKKINDSFGHLAGDRVLKKISEIVRENIRKIDIPARYGGDEIVIILSETNAFSARILAERIRKKVEDVFVQTDTPVTISIGTATFPEDADQKTDLFYKADLAMYKAKQKGKNRVESASSKN